MYCGITPAWRKPWRKTRSWFRTTRGAARRLFTHGSLLISSFKWTNSNKNHFDAPKIDMALWHWLVFTGDIYWVKLELNVSTLRPFIFAKSNLRSSCFSSLPNTRNNDPASGDRTINPLLQRVINSNFPCSLTRNIAPYSNMKNLAFHSLLKWEIIILPILTTSLIHFSSNVWENVLFELESERANIESSNFKTASSQWHAIKWMRAFILALSPFLFM